MQRRDGTKFLAQGRYSGDVRNIRLVERRGITGCPAVPGHKAVDDDGHEPPLLKRPGYVTADITGAARYQDRLA